MSAENFQERIREAAGRGAPLRIRGGGTKDFYGNALEGELLETRGHAGVVSYEPTELVVTARCGTSLEELERILEEKGQMLPFEPPHFGSGATLGGCVAAGLSGPRRASAGSVRDFILGVKIVDGRGQLLSFGGQVMKNVAGYDISRLFAGSLGTLGVIVEVSLKVLPRPSVEQTQRFTMSQAEALAALWHWGRKPLPVSATAWQSGTLSVRLSGAESAVRTAAATLGGERVPDDTAARFWFGIREQTDQFFTRETPLWRLSLPQATGLLNPPGDQLMEWGGALRWLRSDAAQSEVRQLAKLVGGHATLFRSATKSFGAFEPLAPLTERLQRDLKKVFDPAEILNPGRQYTTK